MWIKTIYRDLVNTDNVTRLWVDANRIMYIGPGMRDAEVLDVVEDSDGLSIDEQFNDLIKAIAGGKSYWAMRYEG